MIKSAAENSNGAASDSYGTIKEGNVMQSVGEVSDDPHRSSTGDGPCSQVIVQSGDGPLR